MNSLAKNTLDVVWVDSTEGLTAMCAAVRDLPVIALDTEFMRSDTFYPIPALIQLSTESKVYLIDPGAIDDFTCFAEIISCDSIIKVMHAIGEDIDILKSVCGSDLNKIFDTQVAAALCNVGFSLGYSGLLAKLLNIEVEKNETRSDWLQRPLSSSQISYAVDDVRYLIKMYQDLSAQLLEKGLLDGVFEETDRLITSNGNESVDYYYLKLRGGWKLNRQNQLVLQKLSKWRELVAREKDVPRGRVFPDAILVELAGRLPNKQEELHRIPKIKHGAAKRYGGSVIKIIETTKNADVPDDFKTIAGPLTSFQQKLYKDIKRKIAVVAEEKNIPIELLISKKVLEKTIRECLFLKEWKCPEEWSGWRGSLVVSIAKDEIIKHIS